MKAITHPGLRRRDRGQPWRRADSREGERQVYSPLTLRFVAEHSRGIAGARDRGVAEAIAVPEADAMMEAIVGSD